MFKKSKHHKKCIHCRVWRLSATVQVPVLRYVNVYRDPYAAKLRGRKFCHCHDPFASISNVEWVKHGVLGVGFVIRNLSRDVEYWVISLSRSSRTSQSNCKTFAAASRPFLIPYRLTAQRHSVKIRRCSLLLCHRGKFAYTSISPKDYVTEQLADIHAGDDVFD